MIKKIIFISTLFGLMGFVAFIGMKAFAGHDDNPPPSLKVNICHATGSESNPYKAKRVDDDGDWHGHQGHSGDFLYLGDTNNKGKPTDDDWCEENAPKEDVLGCTDPEATNYNSEATKDDESCEYVQDEPKDYCDSLEGVQAEDENCPPAPTPEPEVPAPQPQLTGEGPKAPSCSEPAPSVQPWNFLVVRNGDSADLRWIPGDSSIVDVFYKEVDAKDWLYSWTGANTGHVVIDHLNPNLGYTFVLKGRNPCSDGKFISPVVVDSADPKIFLTTYWIKW